jgi:hypothetical protein
MTSLFRGIRFLLVSGALLGLASSTALAGPKAPKAKPRAEKKKKKAGPAKKMKVIRFVTLRSVSILYIQFQDKNKNPTKAPPGGRIKWFSNVTKPRKGAADMSTAKWKESKKAYVFVRLPIRKKYVCPPRSYTIRVHFYVGKKRRFTAFKRTKFPCQK